MAKHNKTGQKGEKEAVNYLHSKAYSILECNYRYKRCEIDIIAKDGDTMVFIEVKTRSTTDYGDPESFVSEGQQERIIEAAIAYLETKEIDPKIRYDVIAIIPGKELYHIEDAFY